MDAVVGALLGVLLGTGGTYLTTWLSKKSERERFEAEMKFEREKIDAEWKKEFREAYLVKSVIEFIDETLNYMCSVYWYSLEHHPDSEPAPDLERIEKMNSIIREKEGMIRARVTSLNNKELTENFNAFYGNFGKFVFAMIGRDLGNSWDLLRVTAENGGKVLLHLQP